MVHCKRAHFCCCFNSVNSDPGCQARFKWSHESERLERMVNIIFCKCICIYTARIWMHIMWRQNYVEGRRQWVRKRKEKEIICTIRHIYWFFYFISPTLRPFLESLIPLPRFGHSTKQPAHREIVDLLWKCHMTEGCLASVGYHCGLVLIQPCLVSRCWLIESFGDPVFLPARPPHLHSLSCMHRDKSRQLEWPTTIKLIEAK